MGNTKGNGFENKIAKRLSARFKELVGTEQPFYRDRSSGNRFGGKNSFRSGQALGTKEDYSDIVTPVSFKHICECKFYKTPTSLKTIVLGESKQWDGWLDQTIHDAKNAKKTPMLIVKYNLVNEIVFCKFGQNHYRDQINNPYYFMHYKGWLVYTLENLLLLPDEEFFDLKALEMEKALSNINS